MIKISKLILVSLVLLMALIGSAGATSFKIDVYNAETGNAIQGALVSWYTTHYGGSSTTTNMYGSAYFSSAYTVVGDQASVTVSKNGYVSITEEYTITQTQYSNGAAKTAGIFPVQPTPTPTPSSLSEMGLMLRNNADTAGISGASVTFSGPGVTTSTKTTLSDGMQAWTGSFHVGETYNILVEASGYSKQYWNVVITQAILNNGIIWEYMNFGSLTPTPTPTPTATPTATPTPGSYTSQYPEHSAVYVKSTTIQGTNQEPYRATDPSKSLTGAHNAQCQWMSSSPSSQRFHIDLGSAKTITRIYYENAHSSGTVTTWGVKDFTIWGSNSETSFNELTYNTNTGWTQITASQSSFNEHTGTDTADPNYITITNSNSYRYYAFKFPNNYGDGMYMSVRRIELQTGGATPTPTPTPTPTANPSQDSSPYYHVDVINGITGNYISGATVHFQTTHFSRTLGATYDAGRATFASANTIVGDSYLAEAEKSGYNSGPSNYYTTSMHQDTISSNIYNSGTPIIVYLYPVQPIPTPTPSSLSEMGILITGEDLDTGLSGALVTFSGPGVTTSTKTTLSDGMQEWTGSFHVGEIYRLSVSALGFNTQYWDVVLTQTILNNGVIYEYMDIGSILASCVINVNIVSASTSYLIQGANFGIYDPIHDVWNNATTNNGLGYFDATGEDNEYPLCIGENVTIAAWADGYRYNSRQIIIDDQESEFWLNLLPTESLPTAGNYTIVFTVLSNINQHPLKDVTITIGLGAIKLTNDAGTATFLDVPIGANRNFQFTKTGYQSSALSVNGGDSEVIMKVVELVPVGVTATPTPTFVVNPGISNQSQDLNAKGQTFLVQWADMAIGTGSLVFLLLILYFSRKVLE